MLELSIESVIIMNVTPYAAAKIVNAALAAAGVDKQLPPQMFYNYAKKGYIPTDAAGKISPADLEAWLAKYLAKQGVVVATQDALPGL
jgi:hypothetical protein